MKGWAVIVGILILGMIISSGCTQTASSPSTSTTTSIQPTPLGTEQILQPIPQPTVEVTKTLEKSLPLTERYAYPKGRFNFKYPSGYEIYSTVGPGDGNNILRYLFIANKEREDSFVLRPTTSPATNPDDSRYYLTTLDGELIYIDYDQMVRNSVVKVEVRDFASDDAWIWISNALIHDGKGNTYLKTYDNAISEGVTYNNVKWVKVIDENATDYYISTVKFAGIIKDHKKFDQLITNYREKKLADFLPYIDIRLTSDKCVNYFLRHRTPTGAMVWFEYDINAKWNGEPMPKDGFNQATFEEIVKSLKIEEI